MTSKPGLPPSSGTSMAETYLLAMRCPVYRRRDSNLGFGRELENLWGDGKGKGTSGSTARPKVPMRPAGADCFVVAVKRGNARGAKGAGHSRRDQFMGQLLDRMNPLGFGGRRQPSMGGTSRISREAYVRFCERLGVKFPGPTRRFSWRSLRYRASIRGQCWRSRRDGRALLGSLSSRCAFHRL
jgi:hypothetical protein